MANQRKGLPFGHLLCKLQMAVAGKDLDGIHPAGGGPSSAWDVRAHRTKSKGDKMVFNLMNLLREI
jgi:hypothetical protein